MENREWRLESRQATDERRETSVENRGLCVKKYAQTFVIYVIRSVNRMMAARRIGFTMLKTPASETSPASAAVAVAIGVAGVAGRT